MMKIIVLILWCVVALDATAQLGKVKVVTRKRGTYDPYAGYKPDSVCYKKTFLLDSTAKLQIIEREYRKGKEVRAIIFHSEYIL